MNALKRKKPDLIWGVEGGAGIALIGAVGVFLPQLAAELDPGISVPGTYSATEAIFLGMIYGGAGVLGGLVVGFLRSSLDELKSAVVAGIVITALALPLVCITYSGTISITPVTLLVWLGLSVLIGGLLGRDMWRRSSVISD